MKEIRNILINNKLFLIPFALVFLICIILLTQFTKFDLHIWSNVHHNAFLDIFFKYATWLGDGIFVIIVCLGLLLYRFKSALLVITSYLIAGIPVQLLKRLFFAGEPRPKLFFEGKYMLHLVDGVNLHSVNSFPSGHSASAFALFLCLAIITKNKMLQPLFFVFACLVAYSRVYLSQHFLVDISVGAFIGVAIAIICFYFIEQIKKPWLDKSIIDIILDRKKMLFHKKNTFSK